MDRIEALFTEWQSLQPLKEEDQKRLDDKFRLEFNYNSNHIEGNTLTYGETKLLLIFGETEGRHELREFEEMKAHDVALRLVKVEAEDKERPLSEQFIRGLNRILLVEPFIKMAETADGQRTTMEVSIGEYKSRPNHVRTATGEIFQYATPAETPSMMSALVAWYNEEVEKGELTPIELASLLHYRYIRIHPFEDGNGRIARLLVNYVLQRNGLPMVIVQTRDKDNYLRILHTCDVEVGLTPSDGANAPLDKIQPFVAYMTSQLECALTLSIKAAKGESIEEEDDFEKQLALIERQLNSEPAKEYSTEEAIRVIEQFYLPFIEEIKTKLLSASRFFSSVEATNYIYYRNEENKEKTFKFTDLSDVGTSVGEIKEVRFIYSFDYPVYLKLGALSTKIIVKLVFLERGYTVSCFDKSFNYGQYPTHEQMDTAIAGFRKEILSKIENAMNKDS